MRLEERSQLDREVIENDGKPFTYPIQPYQCLNCDQEFLVEERSFSFLAESVDQCAHCGSRRLTKEPTSTPNESLWRCQQCHGFTIVVQR